MRRQGKKGSAMMIFDDLVRSPEYRRSLSLPADVSEEYELLAQGEYNVNYVFVHPLTERKLVLRINFGSQMHLDSQIEYEAEAMRTIAGSGRVPLVYYTDNTHTYIDHGILVMEYLPGRYPDYCSDSDMSGVMKCLADIHSVDIPAHRVIWGEPFEVSRNNVRLIAPRSSLGAIIDECELMADKYMKSESGDDSVKRRLRELLNKGRIIAAGADENKSLRRCCINTELNSTNFLVDDTGFVRLVDWEKPLYGDPAQDLGHLLAPTTTFWKTDIIFSSSRSEELIDRYIEAVDGRFNTEGVRQRTHDFITVTCLRGLTWCAMAWVEYKDPGKDIVNESTRKKLDDYLSDSFLSDTEKRF